MLDDIELMMMMMMMMKMLLMMIMNWKWNLLQPQILFRFLCDGRVHFSGLCEKRIWVFFVPKHPPKKKWPAFKVLICSDFWDHPQNYHKFFKVKAWIRNNQLWNINSSIKSFILISESCSGFTGRIFDRGVVDWSIATLLIFKLTN